jgi:hypothetical protein
LQVQFFALLPVLYSAVAIAQRSHPFSDHLAHHLRYASYGEAQGMVRYYLAIRK